MSDKKTQLSKPLILKEKLLGLFLIGILTVATNSLANDTRKLEIKVTLFGQPCTLSGQFTEVQLKAIHAISPEKIPPSVSLEQAKESDRALRKSNELPPPLEPYREKLAKRVSAQLALKEALAQSRKLGNSEAIVAIAKKNLQPKPLKEFQTTLSKLTAKQKISTWNSDSTDEISDLFDNLIEPHPEEEFHRTIKRLDVKYTCSFEGDV